MLIRWEREAWEEYCSWQTQDHRMLKRINLLITDICRNGNEGIGKPEPLMHNLSGYWSRRINSEHRLVYKLDDAGVTIVACKYLYGD